MILVHAALLLLSYGTGRLLRVDEAGIKAMTFIGSQKSLAVAVAVLLVLRSGEAAFGVMVGDATVVCVMFHVSQIILDSVISGRWRARTAAGTHTGPGSDVSG